MLLPNLRYDDGIRKTKQIKFGGLNHTAGASDGEIYDMENISTDNYPVLSSRKPRHNIATEATDPSDIYTDGEELILFTTAEEEENNFWYGGVAKGHVGNEFPKRCATIGGVTVIFPDKAYYNSILDEFGSLESTAEFQTGVTFEDGEYAGETAEENTITVADESFDFADYFRVNDAVTISGCTVNPSNNKTAVIREIAGNKLRFFEHTFANGVETGAITIKREVPDLDFVCVNENRLWGCNGDEVRASALGDPFNFNVFDGLDTDSYAIDTGSAGEFTACVSYLGYPIFFKEDQVYKVYGNKPSNFELLGAARFGVKRGCDRSLGVVAETLFYLSPSGMVAYSGGMPQSLAEPFGDLRFGSSVAGSDGIRYYAYMTDQTGDGRLYVYDGAHALWSIEDRQPVIGFASLHGNCVALADTGTVSSCIVYSEYNGEISADSADEEETAVEWTVEFADFVASAGSSGGYSSDPNHKGVSKVQLRVEVEDELTVYIRYDQGETWEQVGRKIETAAKRSFYLPVIPRRCDNFRIKLVGSGAFRLYSLSVESYSGSELPT